MGFTVAVEEVVEDIATMMMNGFKKVTVLLPLILGLQDTMNDECVICLTQITGDAGVAILECRHAFHLRCVFTWFQEQEGDASCPCCRRVAFYDLPVEEEVDDDDDSDTISIYSSEGEEENVNTNYLNNLHLQITMGPEGRSVVGLTG
jgi:hypothetical protein